MTTDEKKQALEAAAILSSEVFARSMKVLAARYVRGWRAATDPAERERFWHLSRALDDVQAELFELLACATAKARGKDPEITAAMKAAKDARQRCG